MTSNNRRNSSNPQDPAPPPKAVSESEPDADLKTPEVDPTEKLRADLEAAKAESDQWRDRFLRKAAELENFRKRSDRERTETATLMKSSVLAEFLPIMDACERALKSFGDDNGQQGRLQRYREGVELLFKQLGDTLSRLGVVALEAKGQKFDPHLHEALSHLETLEYEDNTVIEELRRGYSLNDRLLRPAQVVVASRPKPRIEDAETSYS